MADRNVDSEVSDITSEWVLFETDTVELPEALNPTEALDRIIQVATAFGGGRVVIAMGEDGVKVSLEGSFDMPGWRQAKAQALEGKSTLAYAVSALFEVVTRCLSEEVAEREQRVEEVEDELQTRRELLCNVKSYLGFLGSFDPEGIQSTFPFNKSRGGSNSK